MSDIVEAVLAVLEGSQHSTYNVGTGQDWSINHLLRVLEHHTGQAAEVEQCGPWPNDIREIRADIGRLSGGFGFKPAVPLTEGLASTLAFFRAEQEQGV
jgi:UDP-glucose 4-epimerase